MTITLSFEAIEDKAYGGAGWAVAVPQSSHFKVASGLTKHAANCLTAWLNMAVTEVNGTLALAEVKRIEAEIYAKAVEPKTEVTP